MSTKMGIDQSRFYEDYELISKLKHIRVCGFHVFAADGVLDYKILLKYTDFVFKFVKEAEKNSWQSKSYRLWGRLWNRLYKSLIEHLIQRHILKA